MSLAGPLAKLQRSFAYRVSKVFPSEMLRWMDRISDEVDASSNVAPTWDGVGDGRVLTDGVATNGSNVFTSASAAFKNSDRGKVILIKGGAGAGVDLATTIAAVVSATQITLATVAGATLSGATWGDGTDNSARLVSALTAISGTGATLVIPPDAIYVFGSIIDFSLFDNLTISGYGATFMAATPGATNNLFNGGSTLAAPLTLNANVANNQKTFQVAVGSPLAVGDVVTLNAGELASLYTVTVVAGATPQTVTVDRVILFPYLLSQGARVNKLTHIVENISIKGLTFIGSCEQYIKIRNIRNSEIKDCNFLTTISFASNQAFILSLASVNVQVDHVFVNGPNGAGMASAEQCWVTRYMFTGTLGSAFPAQQGFQFLNSANCGIQEFEINGATQTGIVVDQLNSTVGVPFTVGVSIHRGLVAGCAAFGISDNGVYTTIDDVLVIDNVSGGIILNAQSQHPIVRGARVLDNGGVGIAANQGSLTGNPGRIEDCLVANNVADVTTFTSGILCQAPLTYINNCEVSGRDGAASSVCVGYLGAVEVYIDGCDLVVQGTSTGASVISLSGGPTSHITNTRQIFSGGAAFVGSGINHLSGLMHVDNIETVRINATVPASGLATVAGTLTRLGSNCNFDGCTTPVSMGGFCSRSIPGSANAGSVTLNGAAAVAYPYTDTKSTDRVQLILRTRGGTPGNGAVLVAITPGTGVTLAGNAGGVNDVYDLVIG